MLDIRLVNGVAETLHTDQLGSVRAITDSYGTKVTEQAYEPFGEVSVPSSLPDVIIETKGFIGERYDAGAGLQYLNARYYDPELGIFIQPDWWEVTQPGVGTNRYSYSLNDPMNKRDAGGNVAVADDIIIGIVVGIVVTIDVIDVIEDYRNDGHVNGNGPFSKPIRDGMEILVEGFSDDGMTLDELEGMTPGSSPGVLEGFGAASAGGPEVVTTPVSDGEISIVVYNSGSYTIEFPDGTTYHGKGPFERAERSAREKARNHGYELGKTAIDWTPADSDRDAFKDEDDRIENDGGVENNNNHNIRNSPGRKYNQEDRDAN